MTSLFKSYLKLAIRHSWKNKGPVSINVIGLGLALSMCIFVYILHAYNIEFDSFYENTEDVYRLHTITEQNGEERRNEISPTALDYKLRNEISGINQVSSYFLESHRVKKGNDFFSENIGVASSRFTEMFDLPLWYGSLDKFDKLPLVYLTKPLATKYFGSEVALGKKLTLILSDDVRMEVTVGGVFEKIPLNSSFRFDLVMSQSNYLNALNIDPNDWASSRFVGHYLKLPSSAKDKVIANISSYIPLQNERNKEFTIKRFELIPFSTAPPTNLILNVRYVSSRINANALIIFTVLSLMVFLTACFNLANTSIALISRRLKEIGVRKTLGSGSLQILFQFLLEMGIVSLFAFVIAISTANFTSNAITGLFGGGLGLKDIDLTGVILFVAGFLIFTTLVAGLLPALYAWKFQPVAIMRKSVKLKGVSWLNKTLTIAQYSFSIIVLVTGITFWQNSNFLDTLNLGYEKDRVINLPVDNQYFEELRQEVERIPGVVTAGAANHIGDFGRYSDKVQLALPGDTTSHTVRFHGVGDNYLDVMEVEITSGRRFLQGTASDRNKILVSQSLVDKFFGGKEVINQVLKIDGERKIIIGVTKDIIDDVVKAAELLPTVMALSNAYEHLVVKVSSGDLKKVESELKTIWSNHIDEPYTGVLQKDFALGEPGQDSKRLQKIFLTMALLAGFLSIAGIFSLAKLNLAKRVKEISIRKILGASLRELLFTINKSFTMILLIAMVLGSILSYLISDTVLNMIYKYHIEPSLLVSFLCAAFVLVLSLIIISKAAITPVNSNPINGLSDE